MCLFSVYLPILEYETCYQNLARCICSHKTITSFPDQPIVLGNPMNAEPSGPKPACHLITWPAYPFGLALTSSSPNLDPGPDSGLEHRWRCPQGVEDSSSL